MQKESMQRWDRRWPGCSYRCDLNQEQHVAFPQTIFLHLTLPAGSSQGRVIANRIELVPRSLSKSKAMDQAAWDIRRGLTGGMKGAAPESSLVYLVVYASWKAPRYKPGLKLNLGDGKYS